MNLKSNKEGRQLEKGWTLSHERVASVAGLNIEIPIFSRGNGSKRIVLICLIHGDEAAGTLLARHVLNEWSDIGLEGQLQIIPLANPFAALHANRKSSIDESDLNRHSISGGYTNSLRLWLLDFLAGAKICIQAHSFESTGCLVGVHYSGFPASLTEGLLNDFRCLNMDYIWSIDSSCSYASAFEETLDFELCRLGVRSLTVEFPFIWSCTPAHCQRVSAGMAFLAEKYQLLKVPIDIGYLEPKDPVVVYSRQDVFAPDSGVFVPSGECPRRIRKQENVGCVVPYGNPGETVEINSPCDGLIFYQRPTMQVVSGTVVAGLGQTREISQLPD